MILIHIAGRQGEGKTLAAKAIEEALKAEGSKVLTQNEMRYYPEDYSAEETRKALQSVVGITLKQKIHDGYFTHCILELQSK